MKTKQANKLNMYNAVYSVMNDYEQIWSRVYQLRNMFEKFTSNINRLTVLKTEQEKDLQPLVNAISEKRETLIVLCTPVVNLVLAFAYDKKEKELLKKMNLTSHDLAKSKDSDLIEKCKTIYKAAKKLYKKSIGETEHSDNKWVTIIEYGLSENMIVDLKIALKDFGESRLTLHEAIQTKDNMGKQITLALKKNEKLLKNKMDLLISIFEISNPDFYKSYMEARVIQKTEANKTRKNKEKKSGKKEQTEKEINE